MLGLKDNIGYEYHCTTRIRFLKLYLIYKHKLYAKGRHGTDHSNGASHLKWTVILHCNIFQNNFLMLKYI